MGKSSQVTLPTLETEALQTERSLKVGILGGTFNPPHLGHLIIAEQVRSTLALDRILFLPTAIPPHQSGKSTLAANHRVNMLQLALQDNDEFVVSTIETDQGGKNYTIDTIKKLQESYPTVDFYFIIGADMVEDLPNWHQVDQLVKMVPLVAVKRPGYSLESEFPLLVVDVPEIAISSSELRQMVAKGQSIRYLVPADVRFYIEQEGLYQQ